jgi:molecular chaperone HscB
MVNPASLNQPMSLAANDFELFGLPQRFDLNRAELDDHWKALQREVHPDQHASQGAADKRLAMQWSVRINEAYQRLKTPLTRAAYICQLHDTPVRAEDNTSMPSAFLMLQIQWRETLDEADSIEALTHLQAEIEEHRHATLSRLGQWLDVEHRWDQAVQEVRALMFIERFDQDLQHHFERLENASGH